MSKTEYDLYIKKKKKKISQIVLQRLHFQKLSIFSGGVI